MFTPFAFLAGLSLMGRPRLLPFLVITHGLRDLSIAWYVYAAPAGA